MNLFENIFIFLLISLIQINVNWVIIDELDKIKVSQNIEKYLSYLLFRSVILPLIICCFINLFMSAKAPWKSAAVVILSSFALMMLEILFVSLKIFTYAKWNFCYTVTEVLIIEAVSYYLLALYRRIFSKEVK